MARGQAQTAPRLTAATGIIILLAYAIGAPPAHACEIPVYHYALENWESDDYEVLVFHHGELTGTQRDAVDLLRKGADRRGGHANLVVRTVDLAANPDAIMRQRWGEQATGELPWVAAYYPRVKRIPEPAWAGPLNSADAGALLDSPLRRKIAGELAGRITATWILLESGDRGKDNAAAALLERELRRLEDTLVLPVLEGWGPDGQVAEPEPVSFTMHRLSRDSETERMLVNMLLHSEPDLTTKFAREPLVFPIYGRGLILYALAGAGINEWTITKAAEFLSGPCSCQVKASNPGTDILVAMDWDAQVKQTARERMPPPSGMAGFQDRAAEAEARLAELDAERSGTRAGSTSRAAGPQAPATSGDGARSTAPRTLQTDRAPSSPDRAASSQPARQTPSAAPRRQTATPEPPRTADADAPETSDAPDASEPAEPAGPPAPEGVEATGAEEAPAPDPDDGVEMDDDFEDAAAAMARGDEGSSNDRGVAGLVGLLALIAAVVTGTLTAAVVVRRRRNAVREEEHEHAAT